MGTILSYMLISVHWVSESNWIVVSPAVRDIGKILAPRLVYSIGFGLLILFVLSRIFYPKETASNSTEWLAIATMAMISAWSSIILILLGKQGALVALVCIVGGTLWPLNLNNISFYSGIWLVSLSSNLFCMLKNASCFLGALLQFSFDVLLCFTFYLLLRHLLTSQAPLEARFGFPNCGFVEFGRQTLKTWNFAYLGNKIDLTPFSKTPKLVKLWFQKSTILNFIFCVIIELTNSIFCKRVWVMQTPVLF